MKLIPLALTGLVVFAGVEYWDVAYPASCTTAEEQPLTTVGVMQTAGGVIHSLGEQESPQERIEKDTRGVMTVLTTGLNTLAAAMRGDAPPAAAEQWEARVVSAGTCVAPGPANLGPVLVDAPGVTCPPSGSGAERGLQPAALRVLRCGAASFPTLTSFGGVGSRGNKSDHPSGNAVDLMIPDWDEPAGKALGDSVAAFYLANGEDMDVKYIIWYDQINSLDGRGWRAYTHPSGNTVSATLRHLDHVHVSVNSGASA
jgi:hypothetical protein